MIEGGLAVMSVTGVCESVKSKGLTDPLSQGRMKEEIH